jgi:hypothetical protein
MSTQEKVANDKAIQMLTKLLHAAKRAQVQGKYHALNKIMFEADRLSSRIYGLCESNSIYRNDDLIRAITEKAKDENYPKNTVDSFVKVNGELLF